MALSKRQEKAAPKSARGLILAPTRELAKQIVQNLQNLTSDLRILLVVGGKSVNAQAQKLSRGTDILVATPGRLIDLLERQAVDLSKTRFLVLDEADQMLDIGFIHALRQIAPKLGKDRQTMMFSATMPIAMAELSRGYLTDPVRVEASPPGKVADKVTHTVHFVPKEKKQDLLIDLLDGHREDRALVFARTKHGAERLMKHLEKIGFAATSIHGNKSQGQRDRAIAAFKTGSIRVLVATDVAAPGHRYPGRGPCLQLRPSERARELRPPHRTHGKSGKDRASCRVLCSGRDERTESHRKGAWQPDQGCWRCALGWRKL